MATFVNILFHSKNIFFLHETNKTIILPLVKLLVSNVTY